MAVVPVVSDTPPSLALAQSLCLSADCRYISSYVDFAEAMIQNYFETA